MVSNSALWDRIERVARERCPDPTILVEVQKERRKAEAKAEAEEASRTVRPVYDTETPEQAADRLAARAARGSGWARPCPPALLEATVGGLTGAQDPGRQIARWAATPTRLLMLGGDVGAGKTWAAAAVGHVLADRTRCLLITARDLFDGLRAEQTEPGRPLWRTLDAVGLLIVDDLGTKQPTDWESSTLVDLLDRRGTWHTDDAPRATVITTNLASQEIRDAWGARNGRRLLDEPSLLVRVGRWSG